MSEGERRTGPDDRRQDKEFDERQTETIIALRRELQLITQRIAVAYGELSNTKHPRKAMRKAQAMLAGKCDDMFRRRIVRPLREIDDE